MNLILFDDPSVRLRLLPLTFTRPVAEMRVGIFTIAEKWKHYFNVKPSYATSVYLAQKFSKKITDDNLWVNGAVCPDESLVSAISQLKVGEGLYKNSTMLAIRTNESECPQTVSIAHEYQNEIVFIDQLWKIFQHNGNQIRADFKLITANRKSAVINDRHTRTYHDENIFLEEGVALRAAILNAENGPIYLGKNSRVQEGAIVRGPFSLGEESIISMGGKMRGDTSVGPFCKVGGEVSNSVLFANSNKSHDGFLGNSVLGEWCNLGADTNISNLKNNYAHVKLWSYESKTFVDTHVTNCGLIMGDHSKSGINTMFNTGTVVGVSCNIFGGNYLAKFIPSFSWGNASGLIDYQFDKAVETATRVLARRNVSFTETDRLILKHIFDYPL